MTPESIIFYILSALVITGGIMAVTVRKIFRAAIFLLFSLLGVAGFYFLMENEFIGAVQIVVYVGGIVVLIIFSVFLTADSGDNMKATSLYRLTLSGIAVMCGTLISLQYILSNPWNTSSELAIAPTVKNLGNQMLSLTEYGYILPFEVVSFLLLAAMIGCIVIAIKIKPTHE